MSNDLDAVLRRLANAPIHPGLAAVEEVVLARIAALPGRKEHVNAWRAGALAVFVALGMGIAGSGLSRTSDETTVSLAPFGPSNALLPSTLLTGAR